jgi:hypothetical protein
MFAIVEVQAHEARLERDLAGRGRLQAEKQNAFDDAIENCGVEKCGFSSDVLSRTFYPILDRAIMFARVY